MRFQKVWAVAAIVAVGAWLRLYGLQHMEFKADERISLELAITFIDEHPWSSAAPWPTHGLISSNAIGNAPLFIWIVAPLWALTHDPVGVTALIAAINVLCLIPLWFWALRRMDEPRALLTLAIAAASPFAVLFSRKIWPVDLLLPGMLAVLWSVEWMRDGRLWRAAALAGCAALLLAQLHQSGVITVPLLLVAFVLQWVVDARRGLIVPPARPTAIELGAIAAVIAANLFFWWTYLPYLTTLSPEVLAQRPREPSFTPRLLFNVISEIVPRHLLNPFFVDQMAFRADPLRGAVYYASLALGAPLAVYGVWRWFRAPFTLPVVGVWWWLVIAAFALLRIPTHDYYVLAVMPLPIVLASGAFDGTLPRRWARALLAWRWLYAVVLLAATIVTGAWLAGRGGSRGDYGVTFDIQRAQAQALLHLVHGTSGPPAPHLGELTDDGSSLLRCHAPSWELVWIARWLANDRTLEFDQTLAVCDAWVSTGSDAVYRWTIRTLR